jgi:nitrate/nitrite-specific signal transduction histidine kinase
MGQAMSRIPLRDFTQPVLVANRDEMGALADQINRTAEDLSRH